MTTRRTVTLGFAAALLGYVVLTLVLAPPVVNGDGIGYLKQIPGSSYSPGHLAYLPVARMVSALWGYEVLADLIVPLRLLSALAVVGACVLLFDAGRRLYGGSLRHGFFAASLMGASYAVWRASHEVEVYALGVFATSAVMASLVRLKESEHALRWAAVAGVCAALSFLFHLTLALLAIPLAVVLWRWSPKALRVRAVLVGGVAMALGVGVPLVVVLSELGKLSPGDAFAWLLSSDHGVPYPLKPWTPLVALWGLARSLSWAPYPYEASLAVVIPLSVVASVLLLGLAREALKGRSSAEQGLDGATVLWWCVPLALFAVYFFPSDTERWIFCAPPLALYAAHAADRRPAVWMLGGVALINVAAMFPVAWDDAEVVQAQAVESVLERDDLLVAPGHGWEEHVGLGVPLPAPEKFLLIFEVGAARDRDTALETLREKIANHLADGHRVYVARLRDDPDPRGFKELEWFDWTREDFEAFFEPYRPKETQVRGLWELQSLAPVQ